MGSLERRIAALEALLASHAPADPETLEEDRICSEAYARLPLEEHRAVVTALTRIVEAYAGVPPDTTIRAEEYFTNKELAAWRHYCALCNEPREGPRG